MGLHSAAENVLAASHFTGERISRGRRRSATFHAACWSAVVEPGGISGFPRSAFSSSSFQAGQKSISVKPFAFISSRTDSLLARVK